MWHMSFFLQFKPEGYDLNHVTEVRLNPGPALYLTVMLHTGETPKDFRQTYVFF